MNKETEDKTFNEVREKLYTYDEMLLAYKTGKEHERKYGNCDPRSDRPDFSGFIRTISR